MSSAQAPVQASPTSAPAPSAASKKDYKGFVAGVFSGIAKLSGKSMKLRGDSLCLSQANPVLDPLIIVIG